MKKTVCLFIAVLLLVASSLPFHAKAARETRIAKTEYATTQNLNLRSGAGTKYKIILTIPKGKKVTATSRSSNWYKVTYSYTAKGKKYVKTGWVSGGYLKRAQAPSPPPPASVKITRTTFQTTANLNMRSGASTKYKVIATVPRKKIITAFEKKSTWYRVSYKYSFKGKSATLTGWVSGSYLKEYYQYTSTKKTSYEAKRTISLYQTPDTKKKPLVRIPGGTKLLATQKVVNSVGQTWYRVTYKNKSYYAIHSDVSVAAKKPITLPEPPKWTEASAGGKTYMTLDNLNIRNAPFADAKLIATVPKTTLVKPSTRTSNGWYKVSYGSSTGYISGNYIVEIISGDPHTRTGYQFIDLRTKSPVTAAQINQYIAANARGKSILLNKGQAFINAANKYGVNALYLAAHAIHESGYGTSQISLGKNNLFGFGAFDLTPYVGAYRFGSVEQNIDYIAREMKATYLNPKNWKYKGAYLGFTTKTAGNTRVDAYSEGMNFYYASDSFWGRAIANHMERILPFNESYYKKARPNLNGYTQPAKPDGKDIFPAGVKAVATNTLALSVKKGGSSAKTITKGSSFELLEKHNDYWMRVKYKGSLYYAGVKNGENTVPISFHAYNRYFVTNNLGRVTALDGLNVRSKPSAESGKIGFLQPNQYVALILDKSGKPVLDSTRGWYTIQLSNGKKGWISSSYIKLELK
ncbi:SH3 domain-containing protein [Bacillus massilinigeriensis]|uniref:SH3 domain-containing protein n=1 Tax=Bacillus mediterraneensis TaxID=1805474 RepID=UPI0008F7E6BE|nr:SH3 domain-containing protein [Bacillus mediterraneensis]